MTTMESRRPLVRRGFLKGSIVAFVILITLVAYNVWDYVEMRRLNAVIDELSRTGEPIREPYRTLKGKAVETDRAYRAAATLAEGFLSDVPIGFGSRLATAERDRVWPVDVTTQVRALTDRYREAIALGLRAAAMPFEGFAPGSAGPSMGYLNSGLVNLTRALGLEAVVRAFDGNGDGALEALIAETKIANMSPIFPPVRLATDLRTVAERVRLPAAGLARLDGVMAGFDVDDKPKREFQRYRAEILRTWQFSRGSSLVVGYRIVPPWLVHGLNRDLEIFSKLVSAASRPWPERIDGVVAVGEWPSQLGGARVDVRAILNEDMMRHAQDLALVRAARVVIAIERYRGTHGEQPPARVEELVPDYLTALPIDTFTGTPLMMAADARGYVVYSAGANRRDDGGRDVDVGFASPTPWPRGVYTADTGIRIRYR